MRAGPRAAGLRRGGGSFIVHAMQPARLLLLLLGLTANLAAVPAQPNVLVILVDDMGFSDIGCYGSEIPTPHLDALARGGVRFTQFYNTARCSTTRAA